MTNPDKTIYFVRVDGNKKPMPKINQNFIDLTRQLLGATSSEELKKQKEELSKKKLEIPPAPKTK